jgi:hypothetical protein
MCLAADAASTERFSCSNTTLSGELAQIQIVEILIASTGAPSADRGAAYQQMLDVVVDCAAPGSKIVVRPLTGQSASELPLFEGYVPEAGPLSFNPTSRKSERNRIKRQIRVAREAASAGHYAAGTDIFGALLVAGRQIGLYAPKLSAAAFVISSGWQQGGGVNIHQYAHDPVAFAERYVDRLRKADALPALSHTAVYFSGVSQGLDWMRITDEQFLGLRRFWRIVIDAGGGSLKWFDAALPA